MTQLYNTSGGAAPASTDQASDYMGRCKNGIETALSDYSGSTDPSSGAPVAWGANEVGFKWLDTTNAAYPVLKRWQQLTSSPTYGWRQLRMRKLIWPDTPQAITFSPAGPLAADQTWTTLALTTLLDAGSLQDVGEVQALVDAVLLRVRVTPGASETLGASDCYMAFRKTGTSQEFRVYPQVAGRPFEAEIWVPLDTSEQFDWSVVVGTGTPDFAYQAEIRGLLELI